MLLLRRIKISLLVAISLLVPVACSNSGDGSSADQTDLSVVPVVANFYPIEWLVQEVGGDLVSVSGLTPIGQEPHDLALDSKAIADIEKARAVFYLGSDFQPDVERTVMQLPENISTYDLLNAPGVVLLNAPSDLGKETLTGNKDPHVWLDPTQMQAMASQVAVELSSIDPDNADVYRANAQRVIGELEELDEELQSDLSDCEIDTIVTSHAAFNYFADRYGLKQIAIAGISKDEQPDPATLQQIALDAKVAGVRTVFFEEQLSPELSETVANEIGAQVDLLAALEFDPEVAIGEEQNYITVMKDNGKRLKKGLLCS